MDKREQNGLHHEAVAYYYTRKKIPVSSLSQYRRSASRAGQNNHNVQWLRNAALWHTKIRWLDWFILANFLKTG